MTESPIETPTEDLVEQQRLVDGEDAWDADTLASPPTASWDADPADAAEQRVEVPLDEDEYR